MRLESWPPLLRSWRGGDLKCRNRMRALDRCWSSSETIKAKQFETEAKRNRETMRLGRPLTSPAQSAHRPHSFQSGPV